MTRYVLREMDGERKSKEGSDGGQVNERFWEFGVGWEVNEGRRTVPVSTAFKPCASASQPTMRAISWINALTSRALLLGERSWESFAAAHGWVEMCALGGSGNAMFLEQLELVRSS